MKQAPCGARTLLPAILVIVFFSWLLRPPACIASPPIRIAIQQTTASDYQATLAFFDCPLHKVKTVPPGRFNRPTVDLIIIAKALHLGGLHAPLELVPVCNARRETEEVALGNVVMAGQQLDLTLLRHPDYAEAFYVSAPITRTGEFHKVFYCLDTNKALLDTNSAAELNSKGIGAIGLHWENDACVLSDMGINNVIRVPTFPSLIKMIGVGRADWIPLEVSPNPDMSMFLYGHRLVPIPGIKFSLIDSRHFLVSRTHPDGKRVFNALQKGLAKLRKQGFIRNALIASGFFSNKINDWTLLNAADVERAKAFRPSQK